MLGVLGYQRPFIPHYADIAQPLTALTKKNTPFEWTTECRTTLDTLISAVTEGPTLAQPDMSRPFFLQVDASAYATGAILSQQDNRENTEPSDFCQKRSTRQKGTTTFMTANYWQYFEVSHTGDTFCLAHPMLPRYSPTTKTWNTTRNHTISTGTSHDTFSTCRITTSSSNTFRGKATSQTHCHDDQTITKAKTTTRRSQYSPQNCLYSLPLSPAFSPGQAHYQP